MAQIIDEQQQRVGLDYLTGPDMDDVPAAAKVPLYWSQVLNMEPDSPYLPYVTKALLGEDVPAETAWGRIKTNYQVGKDQVELSDLGWRAMQGHASDEDYARIKHLQSRIPRDWMAKDRGFWEKTLAATAQQVPQLATTMLAGGLGSVAGGAAFAIPTAIGTLAFPTVGEEALVGPAFWAGVKLGGGSGVAIRTMHMEAGSEYLDLLNDGIDPKLAAQISAPVGVLNGLIEVEQFRTLLGTVPGASGLLAPVTKAVRNTARWAIKNKIVSTLAKNRLAAYGGYLTAETAQELAQETTSIVGEELAKRINNQTYGTDIQPATVQQIVQRYKDIADQSLRSFAVMGAPGSLAGALLAARKGSQISNLKSQMPPGGVQGPEIEAIAQPEAAAQTGAPHGEVIQPATRPASQISDLKSQMPPEGAWEVHPTRSPAHAAAMAADLQEGAQAAKVPVEIEVDGSDVKLRKIVEVQGQPAEPFTWDGPWKVFAMASEADAQEMADWTKFEASTEKRQVQVEVRGNQLRIQETGNVRQPKQTRGRKGTMVEPGQGQVPTGRATAPQAAADQAAIAETTISAQVRKQIADAVEPIRDIKDKAAYTESVMRLVEARARSAGVTVEQYLQAHIAEVRRSESGQVGPEALKQGGSEGTMPGVGEPDRVGPDETRPHTPGPEGTKSEPVMLSRILAVLEADETDSEYGLRTLPLRRKAYRIGEALKPSYVWVDGHRTREQLSGTSSIGVSKETVLKAVHAIHHPPDHQYAGETIALIKGAHSEDGTDLYEHIIKDARIVLLFDKSEHPNEIAYRQWLIARARAGDKSLLQSHAQDEQWAKDALGNLDSFNRSAPGEPGGAALQQADRGAIQFLDDGRAIIELFETADVSTLIHELGHIFRRDLAGKDLATIETWCGVRKGEWTVGAEEKFAKGFESYLQTGKAPTASLKDVFQRFAQWLAEVYEAITSSPGGVTISPKIREVYDRLLTQTKTRRQLAAEKRARSRTATMQSLAESAKMTPQQWQAAVRSARAAVINHPVYRIYADGAGSNPIQPGLYYVDPEMRGDIEDVTGKAGSKGFKASLANSLTETKSPGVLPWDVAMLNAGLDSGSFNEFLDLLQSGIEAREGTGGISDLAVEKAIKSGDWDFMTTWTTWDMLRKGFAQEQIDQAIHSLEAEYGQQSQSVREGLPATPPETGLPATDEERAAIQQASAGELIVPQDDFLDGLGESRPPDVLYQATRGKRYKASLADLITARMQQKQAGAMKAEDLASHPGRMSFDQFFETYGQALQKPNDPWVARWVLPGEGSPKKIHRRLRFEYRALRAEIMTGRAATEPIKNLTSKDAPGIAKMLDLGDAPPPADLVAKQRDATLADLISQSQDDAGQTARAADLVRTAFAAGEQAGIDEAKANYREIAWRAKIRAQLREQVTKAMARISKAPGKGVDITQRAEIEFIQSRIDPRLRRQSTLVEREATRTWFEQHPDARLPKSVAQTIQRKAANEMTISEILSLDKEVDRLRHEGMTKRRLELKRQADAYDHQKQDLADALGPPDARFDGPITESTTRKTALQHWQALYWTTMRPYRLFDMLDRGKNFAGTWAKAFMDAVNEKTDTKLRKQDERLTKGLKFLESLGMTARDLEQVRLMEGVEYSTQQIVGIYSFMRNPLAALAIRWGNRIPDNVIKQIQHHVEIEDPRLLKLANFISEEFDSNWDRLRAATIALFDHDLARELWYLPMIRTDVDMSPDKRQLRDEIMQRYNLRQGRADRGFTIARREDIPPEFQKPIRLEAWDLWTHGVQAQEHLIHLGQVTADLHDLLGTHTVAEAAKGRFGKNAPAVLEMADRYVSRVANPNTFRDLGGVEQFIRQARHNVAIAYLSWNLMTVFKQPVSLLTFLPHAGPGNLVLACLRYASGPGMLRDFVHQRDPQVAHALVEQTIEEMQIPKGKKWQQVRDRIGFAGASWILKADQIARCTGWYASYLHAQEQGLSEQESIQYAQRATLMTQSTSEAKDLPDAYVSSEALKLLVMFTNELNQNWNMLTYDMPQLWKDRRFMQLSHMALGLGLSAAVIWSLQNKRRPEDPEDVVDALLTQGGFESVPFLGREIVSYNQGWDQGSAVLALSEMADAVGGTIAVGKQLAQGTIQGSPLDQVKARNVDDILNGLAIVGGIPYAQPRRVIKMIRDEDLWQFVGGPPKEKQP